MSNTEYRVLRPLLTDAGGRANVSYQPGDAIVLEDESRATYLIDAGFISCPPAAPPARTPAVATSDAPEPEDLDTEVEPEVEPEVESEVEPDPEADTTDAARPRRTRKAG